MVLVKEGPCLSIKARPELNILIAAVEEAFKYLRQLVPNAWTKWLVWLVSFSVWFKFDIQLTFREVCILQHKYINENKFAAKHLQFEHTLCSSITGLKVCSTLWSNALTLPGSGPVGHGRHPLLFCLREGKCAFSLLHNQRRLTWACQTETIVLSWCGSQFIYINEYMLESLLLLFSWQENSGTIHCLLFLFPSPPQCPFIDENILALHNKIRTKPVEFPER